MQTEPGSKGTLWELSMETEQWSAKFLNWVDGPIFLVLFFLPAAMNDSAKSSGST